jgi:hypothetical protein
VKRDQRARGRYLGGLVLFGYRKGEAGELLPVPDQQAAIRRMLRLRHAGYSLRAIADKLTKEGTPISHVGVGNALTAAESREAPA